MTDKKNKGIIFILKSIWKGVKEKLGNLKIGRFFRLSKRFYLGIVILIVLAVGAVFIWQGWFQEEPLIEIEEVRIEESDDAEESTEQKTKGDTELFEEEKIAEVIIQDDRTEDYESHVRELLSPVEGFDVDISFGWHKHPVFKDWRLHEGNTYHVPKGTEVRAAAAGRVRDIRYDSYYGEIVLVEHDKHIDTFYANLDRTDVAVGDYVQAGEVLGRAGTTGIAESSQLYFEVRRGGSSVNPVDYLK